MLLCSLSGIVIRGLGLGKKLGLPPTMNLKIAKMPKRLAHGIYAARVKIGSRVFGGVVHFGPRPAVHAPKSFEVHCFGLKKKIYGKKIEIALVKKIRAVKNFLTIAALKKAIEKDMKKAREILENF